MRKNNYFSSKSVFGLLIPLIDDKKIKERYLFDRAQEALCVISQSSTFSDLVNLEILMYIWRCYNMSELENIFGLSKSAIQKRISKMLKEFKMTDRYHLMQFLKEKKII